MRQLISLVVATLCLAHHAAAFVPSPLLKTSSSQPQQRSSSRLTPQMLQLKGEASTALPFLRRPPALDGSLPGDVGFDPVGFSSLDKNSDGNPGLDFYWFREAEIKHGRIAMLATAGILFVELVGTMPFFPYPNKSQMDVFWDVYRDKPALIFFSIIMIAVMEITSGFAITAGRESGLREPGDFKFDPLGFAKNKSPEAMKTMATKEVKNGRLAMLAAAGMILQGLATHKGCLENLSSALTGK
ncbi:unnamed protein product [Vitrella brassicaformis CCMP3155]|uniref:Uncharacterized protein n=1 Tax=Vitrella brassicaformis (strain CCMP3155) TaxID=1169540 RepID=A0A0G4EUZ0_VITBC|nr:unnamed protein product [Vitrella brassicaformis CCMP3155]|mmetsp:Transcript_48360/g.121052  ORF Transcript_48360/g.121052 Transcript_48360/m.121052 type:complete len:243 (-) Transcript_48360:1626-2354(-)|eukprot:CEM01851.1 unnamed protein product [Vitrella brassicaformis CCMP3155]